MPARDELFPRLPASNNVTVVSIAGLDAAEGLTASSLQGIVNARQARLYLDPGPADQMAGRVLAFLRARYNVSTEQVDLDAAIRRFAPEIDGLVVYDAAIPDSSNVASTIAGIRRGLLATPDQATSFASQYGLAVLEDLRQPPWRGLSGPDLYRLAMARLLPEANPAVIGLLRPAALGPRDFLIASRAFVFYVAAGPLMGQAELALLREVLDSTSTNAVLMGWAQTTTGAEENFLVQEASLRGKLFIGAEKVPNLSLLATFRPPEPLKQPVRGNPIALGPNVYVSFAIPDGDNLDFVHGRMADLWKQPARGSFPIAWSLSPALSELAPVYLEMLYGEAHANDSFLAAPSGAAYVFPGLMPGRTREAFLLETRSLMEKADLDILWVLNGYRSYEVPYPAGLLDAYAATLRPKGMILDYGDRATSYSYWMVGDTPALRSTHYWGTDANLLEKVRIDVESVGGPHFLVVTLYPFTKGLEDLTRIAEGIRSLAPDRVVFVGLDDLFTLLLRHMPGWAESLSLQVHGDLFATMFASQVVADGDAALAASRAARIVGDDRAAAARAFEAILSYHRAAGTAVSLVLLLLAGLPLSVLGFFFIRRRSVRPTVRGLLPTLLSGATVAAVVALLVSGTNRVLDGNFWDYPAVGAGWFSIWFADPVLRRSLRPAGLRWLAAASSLGLGVALLEWNALGLVLISAGGSVLLAAARRSERLRGPLWTVSVGLGGLVGFLGAWGVTWALALVAVVLFASSGQSAGEPKSFRWTLPSITARASMGLFAAIPLAVFVMGQSPFFAVRLSWNTGLLPLASGLILGLALSLASVLSAHWNVQVRTLAAFAIGFFILATLSTGVVLLAFVLAGTCCAAWASASAERWRVGREDPPDNGIAFLSLAILLTTLFRIQPVYYSVYLWSAPAWWEYAMYAPPVLVGLACGIAGLLSSVALAGHRGPIWTSS